MTPDTAATPRIREIEALGIAHAEELPRAVGGTLVPQRPRALRVLQGDERPLPAPQRGRQALHRRLLGAADVLGAALALVLVFTVWRGHAGLLMFTGMPLVVLVICKVAGLYDREQMRVVHSTLDEVPLLAQLSGLYTLSLTILAPVLLHVVLAPLEILALWMVSFVTTTGGRMVGGHARFTHRPMPRHR